MISAGGGLIPTFGAVDISHFRLIFANTKKIFRSYQSISAVFLVTGIPRNSFLPNCRSFPNSIY
jgi:hypothetical protein